MHVWCFYRVAFTAFGVSTKSKSLCCQGGVQGHSVTGLLFMGNSSISVCMSHQGVVTYMLPVKVLVTRIKMEFRS